MKQNQKLPDEKQKLIEQYAPNSDRMLAFTYARLGDRDAVLEVMRRFRALDANKIGQWEAILHGHESEAMKEGSPEAFREWVKYQELRDEVESRSRFRQH